VNEDPSPFWTFSLNVYGDAEVQKECLDLQDRHGIDVNLLLFCAYLGAVYGAVLSEHEARQALALTAAWNEDVVGNLRVVRRALKPFAAEASAIGAAAAALRAAIKTAELEAERIEQAMLETWGGARRSGWPRSQPAQAVAANVRILLAISVVSGRPPALPERLIAAALAAAPAIVRSRHGGR
jgi:uncharacterized protein (TIGR02444 family)